MAPLALSAISLPCPLLPAQPARRARALFAARHKQFQPLPTHCCRAVLPTSTEDYERHIQALFQVFPVQEKLVKDTFGVTRFGEQHQKLLSMTTLGASLLMVAFPANALIELPENFVDSVILGLIMAFLYFIVAPLLIYVYLYKRWFKRKMAEAILQFGLVFVFFPGMLLFAPFINLRPLPRAGAKEPWDDIRL